MAACRRCGEEVQASYRFCPWCAAPQRQKLVEFFRAHERNAGMALRVSHYFGDEPHVRFSVWDDGVAQAAVSLDEDEARRLSRFLDVRQQSARRAGALLEDGIRRLRMRI